MAEQQTNDTPETRERETVVVDRDNKSGISPLVGILIAIVALLFLWWLIGGLLGGGTNETDPGTGAANGGTDVNIEGEVNP